MKQFAKAILLSGTVLAVEFPSASDAPMLQSAPMFQEADAPAFERAINMMRWQERIFKNSTTYRSVMLEGERVLRGEADNSASALYQNQNIDLGRTPYLHWRWRVENTFGADIDERTQDGDDYAARVYVIRNGGLAFWRTKAIIYVWSSNQQAGTRWQNAYAGPEVQMWAMDGGDTYTGEWREHVRDIRADWLAAFGEEIDSIDGVALMTDTDNMGGTARAWYADLRFSSSP